MLLCIYYSVPTAGRKSQPTQMLHLALQLATCLLTCSVGLTGKPCYQFCSQALLWWWTDTLIQGWFSQQQNNCLGWT